MDRGVEPGHVGKDERASPDQIGAERALERWNTAFQAVCPSDTIFLSVALHYIRIDPVVLLGRLRNFLEAVNRPYCDRAVESAAILVGLSAVIFRFADLIW